MGTILVGIVTFNPVAKRLAENFRAISAQEKDIIVIDNGSKNLSEITKLTKVYNARIISLGENKGIAYALRLIMDYAVQHKYQWVLTLDQDSIAMPNMVAEYKKILTTPNLGALSCLRQENTREDNDNLKESGEVKDILRCITAGCIMNVEAYFKTPGYDVNLFIDYVDHDICLSLITAGYRILRVERKLLIHEIGENQIREIRFFNKKILVTDHPAWRRYFIARNSLWIAKRYPKYLSFRKTYILEFIKGVSVLIHQKKGVEKFKSCLRGLRDGRRQLPERISETI